MSEKGLDTTNDTLRQRRGDDTLGKKRKMKSRGIASAYRMPTEGGERMRYKKGKEKGDGFGRNSLLS